MAIRKYRMVGPDPQATHFVCDFEAEILGSFGAVAGDFGFALDTKKSFKRTDIAWVEIAPIPHAHTISDIANLATELAGKSAVSHTHTEADTTNLVSDLAGKADVGHTHPSTDADVVVRKESDTANSTTNLADATGLTFAAAANTDYLVEAWMLVDTSSVGTGVKLSATAPSDATALGGQWLVNSTNGTPDGGAFNANNVTVSTLALAFSTNNLATLWAILRNGPTDGSFVVRFAAETTGTITIKTGSSLRYRKTT